jgi:hypothetical protein
MKKGREAFEKTEKEALLQVITQATAFMNNENASGAREWAIDLSKQEWQRLRGQHSRFAQHTHLNRIHPQAVRHQLGPRGRKVQG